ncbi:uncharacterized protein LOC129001680 [Macrosteles quadrilineatus]|uniref:uncharacterized protein LOC129001680 n=1 Tax=Macrosteles quadrilineatus TaxID=74068 RepID=UPI0023E26EFE|nr:uncharacterized protein LOC129001680 [Macrosteles quadrilineatus]
MNKYLFASAFILLLTVSSSTQQLRSGDHDKIKIAIERGLLNQLNNLARDGVKLSKNEAEGKFTQILVIETLKNAQLFSDVESKEIWRIINESVKSREVLKAARAVLDEDDLIAPRVFGAAVMGGTQLATDFVKMMLTRY